MLRVNNNLSETRFLTILLPEERARSLRTSWLEALHVTDGAFPKPLYTWGRGRLMGNETMTPPPRTVCGVSDDACEADA